jgi:hypothetical protein
MILSSALKLEYRYTTLGYKSEFCYIMQHANLLQGAYAYDRVLIKYAFL